LSIFAVTRQRLFFWVLALTFANILAAKAARTAADLGWERTTAELFEVSAIVFLAIAAALALAKKTENSDPVTPTDVVTATLLVALTLPVYDIFSRLALVGVSAYLLVTTRRGSPEWKAGAVAASTVAYFLIGPAVLSVFAAQVAAVDAWLVSHAVGHAQRGSLVAMDDNAGWLRIARGCSSLHALSLATILPVTYSQWFSAGSTVRVLGVVTAASVASVAWNVARLGAMATWPSKFEFLHTGLGASLISFGVLATLIAITIGGLKR
jgi:exosortase/archaeosortase family protein